MLQLHVLKTNRAKVRERNHVVGNKTFDVGKPSNVVDKPSKPKNWHCFMD